MLMGTARGGCVVHVVDGGDEEARRGLRRAARVLEDQAIEQAVVEIAEAGTARSRRLEMLQAALARISQASDLYAVHLHGWEACLLGPLALKDLEPGVRVLCSPHGRLPGAPWAAALLGRLLRRRLEPFDHAPLAASLAEAETLSRLLRRSAEVLPHRVAGCFFEAARREEPRARIVACGRGAAAVDMVTRLSVLLNGREPRIRFSWIGQAGRRVRQLEAAQVDTLELSGDHEAAQALARAWLFVAVSREQGLPEEIARAMAAGVPCLASDIPSHRGLVHHGETGFVCASERDFLERGIVLLRDAAERRRVGEAARAEAARRFTERHYHRALLRAYRLPAKPRALAARAPDLPRSAWTPPETEAPALHQR